MRKFLFAFFCLFIGVQQPLYTQTLVQDTLFISFSGFDTITAGYSIDTVIDRRDKDPRIVGIYEKNKYIFVPVDLLICTESPLSEEIKKNVCEEINSSSPGLKLFIDEFELRKRTNSMIYPRYILNASFRVYKTAEETEQKYLGKLLYETTKRQGFFGDNLKEGFEAVSGKWRKKFFSDLDELSNRAQGDGSPFLDNFRKKMYTGRLANMIIGSDFFIGTEGWIADGEIVFSHREAHRWFYRSGYALRYRRGKTYDSIEFGFSNDYLFHRYSSSFLFRLKSLLMIGFNRWNDFDTFKHKLWDAFLLDYSLSQSIIYNPLDKRSIVCGIGLMENVYYIYSQRVKVQFGVLINLGIKL